MPLAPHQKTQRLISRRRRAATASVHPAGQMNSRRLRSSTALRPAFAPLLTSLCLSATAYLTLPSMPTTAALYTAIRGEESASRSKERNLQKECTHIY